jgi:hypothetical protein
MDDLLFPAFMHDVPLTVTLWPMAVALMSMIFW